MRKLLIPLLAGTAALAGCATYAPVRPVAANSVCGTYGYVDINNDGFITGDEWNTYRTSENCYRAGGFYRTGYYNADYWPYYWSAFDANGDGFLSADEYWSASAWARIDANHNGRIDTDEFVWWPG